MAYMAFLICSLRDIFLYLSLHFECDKKTCTAFHIEFVLGYQ